MSFFWLKSQHKRIELQKRTTQNWQSPCVQTTTQDQAAWAMDVPQDVPWGWVAWGRGGLMPAEKWFLSGPALDHLYVEEMRENRPHNNSLWFNLENKGSVHLRTHNSNMHSKITHCQAEHEKLPRMFMPNSAHIGISIWQTEPSHTV